ncbi:MAG: hypothetical protein AAF726_10415 [Planctomycetota bacterium]
MRSTSLKSRFAVSLAVLAGCVVLAEILMRVGVIDNDRFGHESLVRDWEDADRTVLILGDSFLASEIRSMIRDEVADDDVAVFNTAVHGMGPYEYLDRIERAALPSEPDLVLLGVYIGNDLTNVRDRSGNRASDRVPELLRKPWYAPFLVDHVKDEMKPDTVYAFEWDRYIELGVDPALIEDAKENRINPWLLDMVEFNRNYLLDNVLVEGEANEAGWAKLEELVVAIHGRAEERGADLAMVVFPRSIQIDDSHFEFYRRLTFHLDERTIGSRVPQDRLAALCAKLDVPMLDLLPVFADREGEQLYLENDDHLNREGNRLSAREIGVFVGDVLGRD